MGNMIDISVQVKNSNKHNAWMKKVNKRYASTEFKPYVKTSAAYMEAYTNHKMNKWLKKNPCPIKLDGIQKDMFEQEFLKPWQEARDKELERIRSFVASVYDKLTLMGRYKTIEGKYIEKQIGRIKRNKVLFMYNKTINEIPTSNSKFYKSVQKKVDSYKKKNSSLVCCILVDNANKIGRIVLPKAAQQLQTMMHVLGCVWGKITS